MGAKTFGFHSVAPRCVRTTRWGRCVNDSGRPGIVQRRGMAGIVRHSQTKGRATGNAKPGLKPPDGRHGYKRERNSGRCGARSRIGARYSRTRSEQKVSDRHLGMTTPNGPKRPCGGGRPRAVRQSRTTKNGQVHDGRADKFALRKTLRLHRGYPGGVDWHWRTRRAEAQESPFADRQGL